MFLDQGCGAWQDGTDPDGGTVTFTVWYPPGPDPHVTGLRVVGDLQQHLGTTPWDVATGLVMSAGPAPGGQGTRWSVRTPAPLPAGYHRYAYEVTFDDGTTRRVADPCARYGGGTSQTSAVVVGGRPATAVQPLRERLPWRDLVVYELMIDDFTAGYREGAAPLDAVRARLGEIAALGFNAVELMPWSAWRDSRFDWGYEPCQHFAVEPRYTRDDREPAEHLSRLKRLVSACHELDLHVIMDGVFNHTSEEFPYARLYRHQLDCPLVGTFGERFGGLLDLDFADPTTVAFVNEVCAYWITGFGIDGIRLDAAKFYDEVPHRRGLEQVVAGIRAVTSGPEQRNFAVVLEYIDPDAAPVTDLLGADGYWDNALMEATNAGLADHRVDGGLLAALTPRTALHDGRAPCAYLSSHDHSQVLWQVGRSLPNGGIDEWWRLQPYLVALFTGTGVPLVPNGQEIGEEHAIPEDDHATRRRIMSRPVRWTLAEDRVGRTIRDLHARLAAIRRARPALRTDRMCPSTWTASDAVLGPDGLGLDAARQLVVYHRLVAPDRPEDLVAVVLNFSGLDQHVQVPLPLDGGWTDLLGGVAVEAVDGAATVLVGSHYGAVLAR